MDFSIMFASYPDCWKDAQIAEDHGFTNAWFYDMQLMSSDIYACMALTAANTNRIRLGTQVIAPSNRIAPVTATAIATINYLAPGRVILGVGVGGFSARRSMGLKPWPVQRTREYMQQVRGLLNGEDVLYREGQQERWIRLLHPPSGNINRDDPIPIYIAAEGPRMLALVGEMGDGWVTAMPGMVTVEQQTDRVRRGHEAIAAGAKAAKRDIGHLYTTISTTGCVLRADEALLSPRVRDRVGPFGVVSAHATWETTQGLEGPEGQSRLVAAAEYSRHTGVDAEAYNVFLEEYAASIGSPADRRHLDAHTGHLMYFKPGEERFVTEGMVRATVTGHPEEIIEQLKAWEAIGVNDVSLQVIGDTGRELVEEFSREVIAKY